MRFLVCILSPPHNLDAIALVDLLPPLYLHKSSGKVVLERPELVKSCLRQNVTSFAESNKKCT